jgi:hypothetical protein
VKRNAGMCSIRNKGGNYKQNTNQICKTGSARGELTWSIVIDAEQRVERLIVEWHLIELIRGN